MKTNPSVKIFKFSTLVLFAAVVAALCLIPVTGRAQIFVTNEGNNTIGEYNATTGATINSSFISGLDFPTGIALFGGNLFVANSGNNTIGEYNAATGAPINSSFISSGLNQPPGIAVSARKLVLDTAVTETMRVLDTATTATINLPLLSRSDT